MIRNISKYILKGNCEAIMNNTGFIEAQLISVINLGILGTVLSRLKGLLFASVLYIPILEPIYLDHIMFAQDLCIYNLIFAF